MSGYYTQAADPNGTALLLYGPGTTTTFSFTIDATPTNLTDPTDPGEFTVPVADLTLSCGGAANTYCDGTAVDASQATVTSFTQDNYGSLQLNVVPLDATRPLIGVALTGGQMFAGDPSSPTILPGEYPVDTALGPELVAIDTYAPVNGGDVTIAAGAAPEPGGLLLVATGCLLGAGVLRSGRAGSRASRSGEMDCVP